MPLVTLHTAAARQESGVLVFSRPGIAWRLRVELQRGWIHGLSLDADSDDQDELRRPSERVAQQARLVSQIVPPGTSPSAPARLAQLLAVVARGRFAPARTDAPRSPWDATTPFHPLASMRIAIASLLQPVEARVATLLDLANQSAISLAHPLHGSGLDPDEQAAVNLLSSERSFGELLSRSRVTPVRLLRLLRDAAALGALRVGTHDHGAALFKLVIDHEAEAAERRAAYHAEARALHPDLHPKADAAESERLTARMADLAARYKR